MSAQRFGYPNPQAVLFDGESINRIDYFYTSVNDGVDAFPVEKPEDIHDKE